MLRRCYCFCQVRDGCRGAATKSRKTSGSARMRPRMLTHPMYNITRPTLGHLGAAATDSSPSGVLDWGQLPESQGCGTQIPDSAGQISDK